VQPPIALLYETTTTPSPKKWEQASPLTRICIAICGKTSHSYIYDLLIVDGLAHRNLSSVYSTASFQIPATQSPTMKNVVGYPKTCVANCGQSITVSRQSKTHNRQTSVVKKEGDKQASFPKKEVWEPNSGVPGISK